MFGFSLQKILFLVGIIGAVWYGFKLAQRLKAAREQDGLAPKRQRAKAPPSGRPWARARKRTQAPEEVEDMVQCPVCRSYVAARDTTSCGRDDCPY